MLTGIAMAIKAVIYVISAVFALVVVSMMCSKTFVREKIDIGIYKALGFTSGKLRMQFAMRFLMVAFFGIIIGTALSLTLSDKMLSWMLRSMGIARFVIDYRFIIYPEQIIPGPDPRQIRRGSRCDFQNPLSTMSAAA